MSKLHFLNVKQGDCNIIEHASGRVSMVDICYGNGERQYALGALGRKMVQNAIGVQGNFNMKNHPTHPLDYLGDLGINDIFRFILTHPDMDHMDGLDNLFASKTIQNFWDSGVRRNRPDFGGGSTYSEEDWDCYQRILRNETEAKLVGVNSGDRFSYANQPEREHDGLYILSPNQILVDGVGDDTNDASYVLLYHSAGGKILIPGDAHNKTWEFVLENYEDDVKDCSVLLAPHHGRKSGMDYTFLNIVNPRLVLMGNSTSSKDLAYDRYRNYETITNNQAGNVVCESGSTGVEVYVENEKFALAARRQTWNKNSQGYVHYMSIPKERNLGGQANSLKFGRGW